MNIREKWLNAYDELSNEADFAKQSMVVPFGLLRVYDQLSDVERTEALEIVREWLISHNDKHRFDAVFLVRNRRIKELRSAIESAMKFLESLSESPAVRDEILDLKRLQKELSSSN